MADTIRKADYFAIQVPNRPGAGARMLAGLKAEGVNLIAFSGFPNGKTAQVDLVPERTSALRRAAKKLGLRLGKRKTCFVIRGGDRVGALSSTLQKLSAAKINMTALDAVVAGQGRYGAVFWVKPEKVARTARLLRAR
jgi:prephenate dehydratase